MKKTGLAISLLCAVAGGISPAIAQPFVQGADYTVCFTPGENCTSEIVAALAQAKHNIRVQGYSFTSAPIAKALADAYQRGVDVNVILDKSQQKARYTSARYLYNQGIPVVIDYRPAIAHNKVMIIDQQMLITGSFNYTKAAQARNAENLLIIRDTRLAQSYLANWNKRYQQSKPYLLNTTIPPL